MKINEDNSNSILSKSDANYETNNINKQQTFHKNNFVEDEKGFLSPLKKKRTLHRFESLRLPDFETYDKINPNSTNIIDNSIQQRNMSSLNKRQMTLKQPGIISKHNNYSLSNQESPTRSINHVLKRHARAIVRNIMNSNNKSMYSLKNKQREELENDLNKKSVKLFTEACNMSKAEQDLWVTTELTKELMLKLQAL